MVKESKAVKSVKGKNVSFYDWAQEVKGYRGVHGMVIARIRAVFPKSLKKKESILERLMEEVVLNKQTLTKVFNGLWADYNKSIGNKVPPSKVKRLHLPKPVEVLDPEVLDTEHEMPAELQEVSAVQTST